MLFKDVKEGQMFRVLGGEGRSKIKISSTEYRYRGRTYSHAPDLEVRLVSCHTGGPMDFRDVRIGQKFTFEGRNYRKEDARTAYHRQSGDLMPFSPDTRVQAYTKRPPGYILPRWSKTEGGGLLSRAAHVPAPQAEPEIQLGPNRFSEGKVNGTSIEEHRADLATIRKRLWQYKQYAKLHGWKL